VVCAFKEVLLEKFPWLGKDAAEERARMDVEWLGEQYVRKLNLGEGQETMFGAQLLDESGLLEGH